MKEPVNYHQLKEEAQNLYNRINYHNAFNDDHDKNEIRDLIGFFITCEIDELIDEAFQEGRQELTNEIESEIEETKDLIKDAFDKIESLWRSL